MFFADGTMIRKGQWVKFTPPSELPAAHSAPDGRAVGIYRPAGFDTSAVTPPGAKGAAPAAPVPYPDAVFPVKANGTNVVALDEQDQARTLSFPPGSLKDLAPAEVPADLPRCDRTAHLFEAKESR